MSLWHCGIISVSRTRALGSRLTFYKHFVNEFTEFNESNLGKTPLKLINVAAFECSYGSRLKLSYIIFFSIIHKRKFELEFICHKSKMYKIIYKFQPQ